MSQRNYNNVTTIGTLSAPLASSATSIATIGFSGFPTAPFTVTLDRNTATEEICLVTSVAGSTLTVTRGYDGTAGIAHTAGATIEHTAGAIEYREANVHVNATNGVHGTTGNLVGDQGAQSIFDKTLVSPVAQADVTAGDAVVAYDPTGTRNLFRGINSNGDDVITVDHSGGIHAPTLAVSGASTLTGALAANGGITVPAGKTLTASGGITASSVTNSGNGTVAGTLGVTGATTLTGALSANGGATVPTGKKVTLTDAPVAGTDAANKAYADGLGTAVATASTIVRRDGSGNTAVNTLTVNNAPSAASDATRKDYVDGVVVTGGQRAPVAATYTGGAINLSTSSAYTTPATTQIAMSGLATNDWVELSLAYGCDANTGRLRVDWCTYNTTGNTPRTYMSGQGAGGIGYRGLGAAGGTAVEKTSSIFYQITAGDFDSTGTVVFRPLLGTDSAGPRQVFADGSQPFRAWVRRI